MATYNNKATDKPRIRALPTLASYNNTNWDETDKGKAALGAYNNAKYSVNNYAPFNFSENGWLENVKQGIQNYGEFSYDLDKDALYQQYKDKYIQMGKLAMADTMGQASAMTGGYANSYAQSVGQQAYQGQLDNLNDIVPELYQMALDRYNIGKEDLYNQYGMLLSEYEREYGLYSDEYNKLLDALGIAKDDYYSGADMYNADRENYNSIANKEFNDAMSIWENQTDLAWKEYDADEAARQYANSEYWKEQDWNLKLDQERYQREQDALKKQTPVKEDDDPPATPVNENSANIKAFKSNINPESAHDAIARKMYGPYKAYVAVELAKDTALTDEEKMYLITYYGITETDLQYARDKGYDI